MSAKTMRIKDVFLFLHSEILDFVEFVSPTEDDTRKRKEVVQRIRTVVNKVFPKAKVLVFGSCATGLNLSNSDIDLLGKYFER